MIKFFKEIHNTTKDISIERIKSPLLSAFAISWFIFNWKIILILFLSEKNINEKIIKIDELTNTVDGILLPFAAAIFYAAIYPLINYTIFLKHNKYKKQVEIKKVKSSIEVLNIMLEKVQLESQLEKTKFNAQQELEQKRQQMEEDKMENEHRLEEHKLRLEKEKVNIKNQNNYQKKKKVTTKNNKFTKKK